MEDDEERAGKRRGNTSNTIGTGDTALHFLLCFTPAMEDDEERTGERLRSPTRVNGTLCGRRGPTSRFPCGLSDLAVPGLAEVEPLGASVGGGDVG